MQLSNSSQCVQISYFKWNSRTVVWNHFYGSCGSFCDGKILMINGIDWNIEKVCNIRHSCKFQVLQNFSFDSLINYTMTIVSDLNNTKVKLFYGISSVYVDKEPSFRFSWALCNEQNYFNRKLHDAQNFVWSFDFQSVKCFTWISWKNRKLLFRKAEELFWLPIT